MAILICVFGFAFLFLVADGYLKHKHALKFPEEAEEDFNHRNDPTKLIFVKRDHRLEFSVKECIVW